MSQENGNHGQEAQSSPAGADRSPPAQKGVWPKLRAFLGNRWVILFCRLALGAIFIAAAVPKIINPLGFAEDIGNYHILPLLGINPLAITLPWIELVAALLLIAGIWVRGMALLINGMLVVFIVAISSALLRGIDLNCGCFGKGDGASGLETIIRDVGMLVLGFVALAWDRGELSLLGLLRRRPSSAPDASH